MTTRPYSEASVGALRQLIDFIRRDRKSSLKALAIEEWGMGSQHKLSDFMNLNLNRQAEALAYTLFAEKALDSRKGARKKLPSYMSSVVATIYSDEVADELISNEGLEEDKIGNPRRGIIRDPVTLLRGSGYPSQDSVHRIREIGLRQIAGLSVLIRPSNEQVKENGAISEGLSLSIVNLIPEHIETGDFHPVFKIRQRGVRGAVIDIEGVVLAQEDRIVLSGRDTELKRNAVVSIYYNSDEALTYRNFGARRKRRGFSGVMLGLSNQRAHFASLFRMYAIKGGFVAPDEASDNQVRSQFVDRYESARDLAGVYSEDRLLQVLESLGIRDVADDIGEMMKFADAERIFSVY